MTSDAAAPCGLPRFDDLSEEEQCALMFEAHLGTCTPGGNKTLKDADVRAWFQDMHPNRLQIWRAAAVARKMADDSHTD